MASTAPQIYDTVADKYASVLDAPGSKIVYWMIDEFLKSNYDNSLQNKAVLELACGTGDLLRKAQTLGASTVIGIDVSAEMIKIAQEIDTGTGVVGIKYHVADCSKEIDALKGKEGTFDLVMGNWLFNYGQSFTEIAGMWDNVAKYLKPGGLFIGAFTGFNARAKGLQTGKYGAKGTVTGKIAGETGRPGSGGVQVGLVFATEPPVKFDVFIMDRWKYEESAKGAGLPGLKIEGPTWECLPEGESREFWQDEMDDPSNRMFMVAKSV